MHELSIATEVYRSCRAEIDRRGGGTLEQITAVVGELSGVEPRLLVYAWEAVVAGGPDEGARLAVQWRPARQRCPGCGPVAEHQPGTWLRLCPGCSRPLLVEGGDELDILSIGYEPKPQPQEMTT